MNRYKVQGTRYKTDKGLKMLQKTLVLAAGCQLLATLMLPSAGSAQSLTLAEGLSVVTSQGYDMRIANARESSAEWAGSGATARLKPQVSAYADQTWLQNRPEAVFGGGTSPLSEDQFLRYGITVRQLITDFGKTRAVVEAAQASSRQQAQQTALTQNHAALEFILSYVSLLQAQHNLILADQLIQRHESHLSDARALYKAGEVTLNDVLGVQVALADAKVEQIDSQDLVYLSTSKINFLLLRPFDEPVSVTEFESPTVRDPGRDELLAAARTNRLELKIIDERITAAEARLRSSESGRYPSLFIGGGYSFEENPYRVHEDNWSATIGLTWDLYTGGARRASEGQSTGELSALVAQREKIERLIGLETLDAYRILASATQRETVAGQAVEQARESLRLQRARYSEGEASASEVTDAITALAKMELSHRSALYGIYRAQAQLLYSTGSDMVKAYDSSGQ